MMMTILAAIDMGEGIIIGILVLGLSGLLGFIAKVQGQTDRIVDRAVEKAVTKIQGAPEKHEIGPQPLAIRTAHDCVPRPEFEKHRDEIWDAVNGIKSGVSTTGADIAAIRALREDNGKRLERVEIQLTEIHRTIGSLSESARQVVSAAHTAHQAALTATAALTEAQHQHEG